MNILFVYVYVCQYLSFILQFSFFMLHKNVYLKQLRVLTTCLGPLCFFYISFVVRIGFNIWKPVLDLHSPGVWFNSFVTIFALCVKFVFIQAMMPVLPVFKNRENLSVSQFFVNINGM